MARYFCIPIVSVPAPQSELAQKWWMRQLLTQGTPLRQWTNNQPIWTSSFLVLRIFLAKLLRPQCKHWRIFVELCQLSVKMQICLEKAWSGSISMPSDQSNSSWTHLFWLRQNLVLAQLLCCDCANFCFSRYLWNRSLKKRQRSDLQYDQH